MITLILPLLLLVLQTVVALPKPKFCNLKVQPGKCQQKFNRWYYDNDEMQCVSFIYTGCGGNRNSFVSKTKCEGVCGDICNQQIERGFCRAVFQRYTYNRRKGRCERFYYSGCGGNRNNFRSFEQCRRVCENHCTQPSKTGLCEAIIRRYFYNRKTRNCEVFIYGGCGGNANNFRTKKGCEATCSISYK